ncbi:MAG: 50S ribosomal protein L18 [Patescibacteria group bacterium]
MTNNKEKIKNQLKESRRSRIRARIIGTKQKPRLNVFRSLKHINVQIIDDLAGATLVAASDLELKNKKATKTEKAKAVGKLAAQKAMDKKIKKVVFDRAGYKYHGRVKAVAEGAREGGLEF